MRQCTLVVTLFLAGCGGGSGPTPLFLGHIATTTGPDRRIGQQESWGIRLAIEELAKDKVAVNGRPVQVKHADARSDIEAFESQAVRLVSVSRTPVLFGGNTPEEASRLARSEGIVITPLGFRPRGTTDRVFATGMSPSTQGKALARLAIDKEVERALLLMDERREASYPLAQAFEREFSEPEKAARKLDKISFGKDAKFAELTQGLDGKRYQATIFAGSAADFAEFQRSWKGAEGTLTVFAGDDGALRKSETPVHLATAFAADPEQPRTQEFVQKFKAAFHESPDVHAALAYEGIRLVADALKRAEAQTSDKLLEALRNTKDFTGLTGKLSFSKDQVLERPIYVGKLEGESFTVLKRLP